MSCSASSCPATECCSIGGGPNFPHVVCNPAQVMEPGKVYRDSNGQCATMPATVFADSGLTDRCTKAAATAEGWECTGCADAFELSAADRSTNRACQWTKDPNYWTTMLGASCTDESSNCIKSHGAQRYCVCASTMGEGNCVFDPGSIDPGTRGPNIECESGVTGAKFYEFCGIDTTTPATWGGSRVGLDEGFRGGWAANYSGMGPARPASIFVPNSQIMPNASSLASIIKGACTTEIVDGRNFDYIVRGSHEDRQGYVPYYANSTFLTPDPAYRSNPNGCSNSWTNPKLCPGGSSP
jgi:hypothetical protein